MNFYSRQHYTATWWRNEWGGKKVKFPKSRIIYIAINNERNYCGVFFERQYRIFIQDAWEFFSFCKLTFRHLAVSVARRVFYLVLTSGVTSPGVHKYCVGKNVTNSIIILRSSFIQRSGKSRFHSAVSGVLLYYVRNKFTAVQA